VGVAISSSHIVSAAPSSSGGGLLTLFPGSSLGSHPWDTVLHELLQPESFPWAAVLHKLLQCGSLPWDAVLQEQTAPAWAPLSTGAQVLPQACSSVGFPQVHSILQASTCSSMGSSPGCRWVSAPLWTSTGSSRTACLAMVFSTGCRGISAPAPGAPPPPPSAQTLMSAELFLSHRLTLSGCSCCYPGVFSSPFLTMLSQRHYRCRRWARPRLAVGLSWSRLALALLDMGEASGTFSQNPLL